jgi:hypothetical protein
MSVTVAKRSKVCTVFSRLEPGPWVQIPLRAWVFSVCVCVCVLLCLCTGRGLATSWSPIQGVLPTVPDQETEEYQPYAPKAGASSQVWEQRGRKKNMFQCFTLWQYTTAVRTPNIQNGDHNTSIRIAPWRRLIIMTHNRVIPVKTVEAYRVVRRRGSHIF